MLRQHRLCKRKWTVQRERNEEKRAVTRGSKSSSPVSLQSYWQDSGPQSILTNRHARRQASLTRVQRHLTRRRSITSPPPARAPPPTLLLQDIWWKDMLRWQRRYDFFFLFLHMVNLSPMEENSQGNSADMKSVWEEGGEVPSLPSGSGCHSESLRCGDEWAEPEWRIFEIRNSN